MKYRMLGRTNIKVSEVGFGAWAIGAGMWGKKYDDSISLDALRRALDLGLNFIDTALVYGEGHSEQVISKVLQERKGKCSVSTKIPPMNEGWPAKKNTPIKEAFPKDWIRKCTERSLKNLRVDCIDLQQIHVWSANWVHESDWYETLSRLKEEGKIKNIGVSLNDFEPNEALELVKSGMTDTVQVIYNIFEQAPEDQLFPLCKEKNVGVLARVPLDEGSLTGKFTKDTTFPKDDWRNDYFTKEVFRETLKRVDSLKTIFQNQSSLATRALKFVLSHPVVSTVIPGIRTIKQADENLSASDGKYLGKKMIEELRNHRWNRN